MHFRRLRLAGFKSFVDPTELRIENGLTGIVGPNGCGKSNLLEAIRWVMGESSPKSMRGGGMEDVIFAGTSQRPARDVADVTLLLDNNQRRAPAAFNDSDELEVSRRIERGLGSAYRINGRDARQKDVQLLFADAATGAHSPALVSQGRIGALISAKPQERRLMLEEAAGIAGLHVRRKDAEQRLRAAEANLGRLDDVLRGMDGQIAALRRQARQAEKYRLLSDRVRQAEARLVFAKWREAASAADTARVAVVAAEAAVSEAARESQRLASGQADAAAILPALRDAEAAQAAALQRLAMAREALVTERATVEQRQRELQQAQATLTRDMAREHALAEDAAAALARLFDEQATLTARTEAARAQVDPQAARVALAEQQATQDERTLAARIEAQAQAQAQRRAAEAALSAVVSRRDRFRAEQTRLTQERVALAGDDGLDAAAIAAEQARDKAIAAIADACARIEAAEAARTVAESAREQAQRGLADARGISAALEAEARSLVRVLSAVQSGKAPALVDSVSVDPGFEAAFAAALGDDLSASIAHPSEARSWLGTGRSTGADPALPAGVARLADHVRAPAEIASRLAQIGVVSEMPPQSLLDTLAVGQRLVSHDGRLWRWDGFHARGGNAQAATERLIQRNRLTELERQLPDAQAQVSAATAALDESKQASDAAQADERAGRAARTDAERARDSAMASLARLQADIARRASRIELLDASLARTAQELASAEREHALATEGLASLPDLDQLGRAAGLARASVEASRAMLASLRADHAALVRGIDNDARRLQAIADERMAWERRRADSAAQHQELHERAERLASDLVALSERPAEIAQKQAALAVDLAAAETGHRAAIDGLAEGEALLRAIETEARGAAERLAQAREERARLAGSVEHHDLRRVEMGRIIGERFQCSPPLLPQKIGFDAEGIGPPQTLSAELERLQREREGMGPVNLRAETELEEIENQRSSSEHERAELETAIARLRGSIGALNREGRVRLLEAFEKVDAHFRELFTGLFAGGAAHLALVESDDPLEAGLEIMAQPPGKKLQTMTLLSGGEQALTACALIFALFRTNPAPICVLDEVDAPLDDANVERFCDLLDRMSELTDTRFLIVTHNAVTMSRMHRLFGVTMGERGVSQLVSVDLARAEMLLAAE